MTIKTNLHISCPKCGAEDGLIWHPKPNVGWYCHECGEGFYGLPDLHDILKIAVVIDKEAALSDLECCDITEGLAAAIDELLTACKTASRLKKRGRV